MGQTEETYKQFKDLTKALETLVAAFEKHFPKDSEGIGSRTPQPVAQLAIRGTRIEHKGKGKEYTLTTLDEIIINAFVSDRSSTAKKVTEVVFDSVEGNPDKKTFDQLYQQVLGRIKDLESEGILRQKQTTINFKRLRFIKRLIGIDLDKQLLKKTGEDQVAYAHHIQNIAQANEHLVVNDISVVFGMGGVDLLLYISSNDPDVLNEFILKDLQTIEGIRNTLTFGVGETLSNNLDGGGR